MDDLSTQLEALYRKEYKRLFAVLTRLFGPHNLTLAEDILHDAFSRAIQVWQQDGIPENPAGWLIQTAKNRAIDTIRAQKTKTDFAQDLQFYLESEWSLGSTVAHQFAEEKIKDDQLRMIFFCCHPKLSDENRLPFILQTLCGFSLSAISRALVLPVETVKKRLLRTKKHLRNIPFEIPEGDALQAAMDTVHTVLYLLFNEGYNSSHSNHPMQLELCHEAIGLLNLLLDEPVIVNRDTFGLLALMHFHLARAAARLNSNGEAIPLDLQDRTLWQQQTIAYANQIMHSIETAASSPPRRFYLEACIAQLHCNAQSFATTDWRSITLLYQQLVTLTHSPVAELNLAIAIAYSGDNKTAIVQVENLKRANRLPKSHMPDAVLGHLFARQGDADKAYAHARAAQQLGGTAHEHKLMFLQLERLLTSRLSPTA